MKNKIMIVAGLILVANGAKADPTAVKYWQQREQAIKSQVYAEELKRTADMLDKYAREHAKRSSELIEAYMASSVSEDRFYRSQTKAKRDWGINYISPKRVDSQAETTIRW